MQAARAFILSLVLLGASLSGAFASGGAWVIAQSDGVVRVASQGSGMQPASLNAALRPGDIITTGGDGYAILRRGDQQIVVSANSRMSLPAEEQGGFTRVVQDLGTLMFKVDKRKVQHFEVNTPVVAAVVKGTTFTVTSTALGDSVHVAEGLVEVRTHVGGAVANVPGGSTVFVSRDNPGVIVFERNESAPANDNAPAQLQKADKGEGAQYASLGERIVIQSAIGAGPLDFAGLTDGLVATAAQPKPSAPGGAVGTIVAGLNAGGGASASVGATLGGGTVTAGVDVGLSGGGVTAGVEANVGGGAVTAGADVGLGGGGVTAGLDAGLGGGAVTAGVDVGLGGGGVTAGVGADVGGGAVTAGLDAGIGGGGLTAGLDAGLGGAGGVNLGAGVTAGSGGVGVDVGAGLGGTGVDVGAGVGSGGLTAGLDVGGGLGLDVGLGGGGLDVGLDLGGGGLDLGLGGAGGSGAGGAGSGTGGSGSSGSGGLVGGLLGGLLGN